MSHKTDAYTKITDQILAALERGVAPWVRPWTGIDAHNGATGHVYKGINIWSTQASGHLDPRWYTFKQLEGFGRSHVRKGEHGTKITRWIFPDREADDGDGETTTRSAPILRLYVVFNFAQIEWDPAHRPADLPTYARPEGEPLHARATCDAYHARSGVSYREGGGRAYYNSGTDSITVPPAGSFNDWSAYYATRFHEMAHSTGHASRLKRSLANRFGSEAYAAEELVAELAAAFLAGDHKLDGHLQHAEYIGNWIRVLKGDPKAIFTAARLAREAAALITAAASPAAQDVQAAA